MCLTWGVLNLHTTVGTRQVKAGVTGGPEMCHPDTDPPFREFTFGAVQAMYTDSEDLLRNIVLAPKPQALASFYTDFRSHQQHRGWQVKNTSQSLHLLCHFHRVLMTCQPSTGSCI